MKKQILKTMLCGLLLMPFVGAQAQSTVQDGQSTEGKDFWVTFLKADSYDGDDKSIELSLTISAKEACEVTIENAYSGYSKQISLAAGELRDELLYTGTAKAGASNSDKVKCYSFQNEKVDTTAIHITSTANISLFASNWKSKSFDATNVLPTKALLDDYYIQSIAPSAHESTQQGTHFAIVATEDNTIVDYCLTARTNSGKKAGDTITTPALMKGQVWYVWTGNGGGDDYDLSGTHVKARDGKHIAVFQGAPHTNIPFKIRDRDHIFSQAMPTQYWGNTFAITSSMTRKRDKIRIMALNDETEVRINGKLVHTFHFEGDAADRNDTIPSGEKVVQCTPKNKRTFEFEIGAKGVSCTDSKNKFDLADPLVEGTSCFIETSCPVAVHLFMVSNRYDNTDYGDPAMLWINPIEQVIDKITFATYKSSNTHYFNVVTSQDNINDMYLDGNKLSGFTPIEGSNSAYYFTRQNITHGTHTLEGAKGFIAHVYGYGNKESYGYSAGGATKPLTQYITINGQIFTPDSKNILCGEDTIRFACHPDYEYEKIEWYFGDGTSNLENKDSVPHEYEIAGVYNAYVLIYRNSTNVCVGQNAVDSIPITVNIGNYKVNIKGEKMPECTLEGDEVDFLVFLDNPAGVSLTSDSVQFTFSKAAKDAGFSMDKVKVQGDTLLIITLPSGAKNRTQYDLHLHIGSECPNSVLDKDLAITPTFDIPVLAQRYNNVLGVLKDSFPTQELTNFVWFHDGDTVPDQETSVLYLDEKDPKNSGEYKVCFTIKETGKADINYCTCPIHFTANSKQHEFEANPDSLIVTATYIAAKGGKVFVNIDYNGETNLNCYAEWYDVSGRVVAGGKYENLPDGGCTIDAPATEGLYLLRVVTGKGTRSFKFIVNN